MSVRRRRAARKTQPINQLQDRDQNLTMSASSKPPPSCKRRKRHHTTPCQPEATSRVEAYAARSKGTLSHRWAIDGRDHGLADGCHAGAEILQVATRSGTCRIEGCDVVEIRARCVARARDGSRVSRPCVTCK